MVTATTEHAISRLALTLSQARIGVVGCDPTAEDHCAGRAGSPTGHGQNGHQNAASSALGEVGGVKPLE